MADGTGIAGSRVERRTRRSAMPIAAYLVILAFVALLPTFVFSAVLLERNNEAQERNVETLITGNARAIMQAVDREILANITTLRLLATAPELVTKDWAAFHARVQTALEWSGAHIFVADKWFRTLVSTRVPATQQNFGLISDQETARRAIETGQVAISDAVLGSVSKLWVINIIMPILDNPEEPLLIGFNREAGRLSVTLLSNKMPEGWRVSLLDSKGVVIADSDDPTLVGSPLEINNLPDLSTSSWQRVRDADKEYVLVSQRSLLTGWTVVAYADETVVSQPLATAFWSLLAGGIVLAAGVVLAVFWVSARISRSVRRLADDARRLGSGQPVEARPFPIVEVETVSVALGDASRRRQAAETEVRFLMRELAHRSKNQMTVIAAMAKQTARGADSVPDFVAAFEKRIFGLARSTDLLLTHGVAGVDLKELLVGQIQPFAPIDGTRVVLDGPAIRLNAQAGQIVGMAAHELATNAVKYGALAAPSGQLRITWSRESEHVVLIWRESGFTPQLETTRRGFGTTVLESMVGRSLGADVTRTGFDDGLQWRLSMPLATLDPTQSLNTRTPPQEAAVPAVSEK
jgi:two-component sensor histidine kinase